jgi:hypothetical protein
VIESFEKLFRLLLAIKESNSRIVVNWTHKENLDDGSMVFCRAFWSFEPYTEGLKYYKPLMSVDGTHL